MTAGSGWRPADRPRDPRHAFGLAAEDRAARMLERSGARILERRFRCRAGELDLVAEVGSLLLFVEVKARRDESWGRPAEAVTPRKQLRLARAALRWMQLRGRLDRPCRFDVVEVVGRGPGGYELRHLPDAFRLPPRTGGRSGRHW